MMIEIAALLGLGLVLGLRHALDADHIAAVSTIATQTKSLAKASKAGLFWGIGHTATLLVVGIAVIALKISVPENFALLFEMAVGFALIILGIDALRKFRHVHAHAHAHNGVRHFHVHAHKNSGHDHVHRPLAMGVLHGLAGSSALMLLVLASASTIIEGVAFILIFGIGTIAGMMAFSTAVGLPLASRKSENIQGALKFISGGASIAIGVLLVCGIVL